EPLGQRESRIVLRIAADLQHALAELGERNREVRRHRALADAALAIDGEDLRAVDLERRIEPDLDAALAIQAGCQVAHRCRGLGYDGHAATMSLMPSMRSSSSSPARDKASSVAAFGDQYLR